jgi:hypothetical protein
MSDGTGYNQLLPSSSSTASMTVPTSGLNNDGTVISLLGYLYADYQKWTIAVAN